MKLEGYSKYEIHPDIGQVWNYRTNRYVKFNTCRGYLGTILTNDKGERKFWYLHRLIWCVSNGDIPEGMQVNHCDENKLNCCLSNLNLLTCTENINWGTANKRRSIAKSIPIIQIGENIKLWLSATDAQNIGGFNHRHISECCNKKRITHKGYQWQYMDDYLADWWEEEMEKGVV